LGRYQCTKRELAGRQWTYLQNYADAQIRRGQADSRQGTRCGLTADVTHCGPAARIVNFSWDGSSERCHVTSGQESGTEGYAEEVETLVQNWETISFADHHRPVLHLLPTAPCRVLDIGAGTGRDAASFAAMGHRVVAVEPIEQLRAAAMVLHPSSRIEWLNDSLPDLAVLMARGETFELIMLTAVWMHLDEQQRRVAMPKVTSMLCAGGVIIMSLRHGPVPVGRRMFEVSAEETIQLARVQELHPVLHLRTQSVQQVNRLAGVTWTRLAFAKAAETS
jgi:2-polyprenyl-3-methyl-5-hydroxy-6-metoxy-1,4-benzoquinol methylase